MKKNEVIEQLIESFKSIGISITKEEIENNIDIQELFIDSLMFISAIVQLEQDFDIEFEEAYLSWEMLSSINALITYICDQKNINT